MVEEHGILTQSHLDQDERQFVDSFYLVDSVLQYIQENKDRYSVSGPDARLLISTCRNHYLTVNAVFADVRTLLVSKSGLGRRSALAELRDPSVQSSSRAYKAVEGDVSVACKAAREKFAVWNRAAEIVDVIEKACDAFSAKTRERDALKEILGTTANTIDGEPIEDSRYIELNTSRVSALEIHEQVLSHVLTYAESVLAVVKSVVETGVAEPPDLLSGSRRAEDWKAFYDVLSKYSFNLGGTILENGKTIEFLSDNHTVLVKANEPSHETVRDLFASLASVEEKLVQRIIDIFPPNVAKRRLPSIFRMTLPMEQARAGKKSATSVVTEIVDLNNGVFESFTIGCPNFGMPLGWYQEDIRRFNETGRLKAVELLASMLAKVKTTKCCRVLLLPEYFVPESMRAEISKFCEESGCIAIYGLEARNSSREPGAVINEAIVDFSAYKADLPAELRVQQGRSVVCKCYPSKFEPKLETQSAVSVFRQTPIGSFAVVICSDLLEHSVIDAIHRCPTPMNAVFVVAMNPSPGVFEPLIRADAVRLHCPVIVASNCVSIESRDKATAEGTGIAEPKRTKRNSEFAASKSSIDGKRRIIQSTSAGAADDGPSVSFSSTPVVLVENGPAGVAVYRVDYSFMNDMRTDMVVRDHLPPSSSSSLDS
jgi:hypothetical protein